MVGYLSSQDPASTWLYASMDQPASSAHDIRQVSTHVIGLATREDTHTNINAKVGIWPGCIVTLT